MPARPIILDANILIRFVLGERVPSLLAAYAATIDFLVPDTAFDETPKHVPEILRARGDDGIGAAVALAALDAVTACDQSDWSIGSSCAKSTFNAPASGQGRTCRPGRPGGRLQTPHSLRAR